MASQLYVEELQLDSTMGVVPKMVAKVFLIANGAQYHSLENPDIKVMAILVLEFSRKGYKIRKVFV